MGGWESEEGRKEQVSWMGKWSSCEGFMGGHMLGNKPVFLHYLSFIYVYLYIKKSSFNLQKLKAQMHPKTRIYDDNLAEH